MAEKIAPPPYVKQADRDFVSVEIGDGSSAVDLERIGFRRAAMGSADFTINASSKQEKAKILAGLRDKGFYFSRGREWSPAEVFEWLREEGLIGGVFSEIYWTKPDAWHTRDGQ
jgi:hypothetical protein